MERRVLIAMLLSFAVLYAWQAFFIKPVPKPTGAQPATQAEKADATNSPAGMPTSTPTTPSASATSPQPAEATGTPVVGDASEHDVAVETKDVLAVFTNRGARLKSWRLKHYKDSHGEPLELVARDLPGTHPLPFSLHATEEGVTNTLNNALYSVRESPTASAMSAPSQVRFEYQDTTGLHVVKEFRLQSSSYVIEFRATVTVNDKPLTSGIVWGPGLGDTDTKTGRLAVRPGGLLSAAGKEQRLPAASIAKQANYEGAYKFAGVDDHYFLTAALDPGQSKVKFQPLNIPVPAGTTGTPRDLMSYEIEPAGPDAPLKFYVGPKDFDQLGVVDPELRRAINFGIFTVIVVPLLNSLKWINGFVGNWGFSIIVLTVIINLIIFPLRHKSVVSMRKMQEIQPEMKAIQDRYAKVKTTDPAKQKMNQEIMALYRERGVNPASGCVPMLLPFPVLIAFYSLLSTAIELRGAPFALWIHDLSIPDPYYVTPILMGGSQLWQQWMAPAAGMDPVQRKMMMIMPVVFTFLFIGYPSGVALYWLSTNLWSIGQQYFTNYLIGPPNIRTPRPPAERRLKRVGSGKTEAAAEED